MLLQSIVSDNPGVVDNGGMQIQLPIALSGQECGQPGPLPQEVLKKRRCPFVARGYRRYESIVVAGVAAENGQCWQHSRQVDALNTVRGGEQIFKVSERGILVQIGQALDQQIPEWLVFPVVPVLQR